MERESGMSGKVERVVVVSRVVMVDVMAVVTDHVAVMVVAVEQGREWRLSHCLYKLWGHLAAVCRLDMGGGEHHTRMLFARWAAITSTMMAY